MCSRLTQSKNEIDGKIPKADNKGKDKKKKKRTENKTLREAELLIE